MRSKSRKILVALVAVLAFAAVAAASASAALPEFAPHAGSKGETFPLAVSGSAGEAKFQTGGIFPEPVRCGKVKVSGSIVSAKSVSLTDSFEECRELTGEKASCENFAMSGTGTLAYLNKATKQVGVVLPVGHHLLWCDHEAVPEEYRGTIISPVTPVNSETTKPEIRYHAKTKSEEEFVAYENEKGEKVTTKFEWEVTEWNLATLEIGTISLTSPRGLTIKA